MDKKIWKKQWQYFHIYLGNIALDLKTKNYDKKRKVTASTSHQWGWKINKREPKKIKPYKEEGRS
jgi:hypothetical protein